MMSELPYKKTGNPDAPCVVLIGTKPTDESILRQITESFSDYCCLIPDLSEVQPFSNMFTAESIADLIKKESYEAQAHLVSFTSGIPLTLQVLAQFPEQCISASLLSPSAKDLTTETKIKLLGNEQNRENRLNKISLLSHIKYQYYRLRHINNKTSLNFPLEQTLQETLSLFFPNDQHSEISHAFSIPCLLLGAEAAPREDHDLMKKIASMLPVSETRLVKSCHGNIIPNDTPTVLNTIREWMVGKPLSSDQLTNL